MNQILQQIDPASAAIGVTPLYPSSMAILLFTIAALGIIIFGNKRQNQNLVNFVKAWFNRKSTK